MVSARFKLITVQYQRLNSNWSKIIRLKCNSGNCLFDNELDIGNGGCNIKLFSHKRRDRKTSRTIT